MQPSAEPLVRRAQKTTDITSIYRLDKPFHISADRCRPVRMPPIVVPDCATEVAENQAEGVIPFLRTRFESSAHDWSAERRESRLW